MYTLFRKDKHTIYHAHRPHLPKIHARAFTACVFCCWFLCFASQKCRIRELRYRNGKVDVREPREWMPRHALS